MFTTTLQKQRSKNRITVHCRSLPIHDYMVSVLSHSTGRWKLENSELCSAVRCRPGEPGRVKEALEGGGLLILSVIETRLLVVYPVAIHYDDWAITILTLTYILTPWCRVLLEKLTGLQLVKKFHAFHGTRMFITALTSVRHPSLPWASPIQSIYPHPTSWRCILILSTHLHPGLPSGLFPSGFPTKTLYIPSPHPYAPHAHPTSFFSILSPTQYWVRITNHLAPRYAISSIPPLPRPSYVQIFSSTPCS